MKKVEAIVRPERLEEIKIALTKHDIKGLTMTQVVGCGNQKGKKSMYRGSVVELSLLPKLKLEVVCEDDKADEIAEVIIDAAKTGQIGDGKIFIYDIDKVIRIRTGQTGDEAL